MTPRKPAATKATPAQVRKPTAAEIAAASTITPGEEVWEEPPSEDLDPELDFDLGAWRDEQAQRTEATRTTVRFRLDDRRPGAEAPTVVVDVPLLSHWSANALRRLEDRSVGGIIDSLGMATGDADLVDVLGELTGDEVGAVLEHLINASGVTPGESKPSGASSRNTRRR